MLGLTIPGDRAVPLQQPNTSKSRTNYLSAGNAPERSCGGGERNEPSGMGRNHPQALNELDDRMVRPTEQNDHFRGSRSVCDDIGTEGNKSQ